MSIGRVLVGASGYSYPDWKGVFYPEKTSQALMLPYYASVFSLVELNFSYYRMPTAKTLASMEAATPDGFLFSIKTHRSMTHDFLRKPEEDRVNFQQFRAAIIPLVDSGKLGCVLAQFPWSFKHTEANLGYLSFLREELSALPVVVEFRNREWISKETFYLLHEMGFGYCCVDEPDLKGLLPPVALATSPQIGYVRFHGRNAAKWWKYNEPWERYNYLYSREELLEWIPKIRKLATKTERTFVLMNNCHAGHAVINARMLTELLNSEID